MQMDKKYFVTACFGKHSRMYHSPPNHSMMAKNIKHINEEKSVNLSKSMSLFVEHVFTK